MIKPPTILFQPSAYVTVPRQIIRYAIRQRKECGAFTTKGAAKTHNEFIKNICTWLLLKNITTSGIIQHYRAQLSDIAAYCKIKRATLEKRISWLEKEGLLRIEHKHLKLASGKTLATKYGINITEKIQIYYDPSQKARLEDEFARIQIEDNKEPGKAQYHKKINGHPLYKSELAKHLFGFFGEPFGYSYNDYCNKLKSDEEFYRTEHQKLRVDSFKQKKVGQSSFEIAHTLCPANPDIELNTATHAEHFNFKVQQRKAANGKVQAVSVGFHHLKRRLVAVEILTVKKRLLESDWRARKDEKHCHFTWVAEKKATVWRLPDELIINEAKIYGSKTVA